MVKLIFLGSPQCGNEVWRHKLWSAYWVSEEDVSVFFLADDWSV